MRSGVGGGRAAVVARASQMIRIWGLLVWSSIRERVGSVVLATSSLGIERGCTMEGLGTKTSEGALMAAWGVSGGVVAMGGMATEAGLKDQRVPTTKSPSAAAVNNAQRGLK